jgi:hypothetical protein
MKAVLTFIKTYFNFNILVLFLISSLFLLLFDYKEYKAKGLTRENKFSLWIGIVYIVGSLVVYCIGKFVNV